MNVQIQKCEICADHNLTNSKEWVRVYGATQDVTKQQQRPLDFCSACKSKVSVADLPKVVVDSIAKENEERQGLNRPVPAQAAPRDIALEARK